MPASKPTPVPFMPPGKDPGDASLEERIVSEDIVWKGDIFNVGIMDVEMPNKKHGRRDVAHHTGAVAVVALVEDARICLVRQYRPILGRVTVEIPAGKLEAGEDPEDCAKRELLEETGFLAKKVMKLTTLATSPGFTDELIHIYFASQLTFEGARPDDDEFLHVDLVPVTDFIDAVLDGKIEDAKTVAGALALDAIGRRMFHSEDSKQKSDTKPSAL